MWRVGDDNDIDVTSNRWVAPWNGPPRIFCIKDLWDKAACKWNLQMIHAMYSENQALEITCLQPSMCGLRDKLIWRASSNGDYSAAAEYKMLMSNASSTTPLPAIVSSFPWKDY